MKGVLRSAAVERYIARADDYHQDRADAGAVMDRLLIALRSKEIG
nr:hypothetical protein [Mycobacterium lepraemurium]